MLNLWRRFNAWRLSQDRDEWIEKSDRFAANVAAPLLVFILYFVIAVLFRIRANGG